MRNVVQVLWEGRLGGYGRGGDIKLSLNTVWRECYGQKAKNDMFGTNALEGFEHHAQMFKLSSAGSKELKALG